MGILAFFGERRTLVKDIHLRREFFSRQPFRVGYGSYPYFIEKYAIMIQKESIPNRVVERFGSCITNSGTYLSKDSILVFVCGAKSDTKKPTARDTFMEYASRNLPNFQFFVAERFFEHFQNTCDINLLSLENKLTEFSNCVMIFLESPGAFTELGAFANHDKIIKMLLTINDVEHKDSSSFITAGPVAKVNKESKFKPVIYAKFQSILTASSQIEDRLRRIEIKRRKNIDFATHITFTELPPRLRMLFLMDLISIFNPLNLQEIIGILASIYSTKNFDLNLELSMLRALGLAELFGKYYTSALYKNTLFLDYVGFDAPKYRADIINHYHKYIPDKIEVLHKKLGLVE